MSRYDLKKSDNLAARKIHTQIRELEKALNSVVAVATVSFMLMTFDGIRQVGVSLLASAELLGTVYLYLDYTVPVDAIRAELDRLVKGNALWDGKVCGLQVTDCKESVVELRLLTSSDSASAAWDLRCCLREKMIAFVQKEFPGCLPRSAPTSCGWKPGMSKSDYSGPMKAGRGVVLLLLVVGVGLAARLMMGKLRRQIT